MLELRNVSSGYGAIEALKSINLKISQGEIVTLIGANGAGKSTTLRNITGVVPTTGGDILFEDKQLNGIPTHQITAMGISLVPEGRAIFANLSVFENLEMGAYLHKGLKKLDQVFTLFPRLKERRKQAGGTLSGGEQQMLAIGRALMAQPRLLLLDEPSLGLAPIVVHTIFKAIGEISWPERTCARTPGFVETSNSTPVQCSLKRSRSSFLRPTDGSPITTRRGVTL